ncbi:hypothetical protein Tco_0157914 [Tanacetum coccineum]
MTSLKFADTHNLVAFLSKPAESEGFEQIVDFLNANPIKYTLTVNPTIYTSCIEQFGSTVKAKTVNGEVQLQALVDGKKIIITKASVRSDLQLDDEEGMDCLPIATIFEELTMMGAKTTAWNEFSSTMASAINSLATNQKFNFSKYIFKSMVRNVEDVSGKFLMYPRNMRRVGKGFSERTPLFPTMVVQAQAEMGEDEAVNEEMDDSLERAATTATSLDAEHDRCSGPRRQDTMRDTISQTGFENVSKTSNDSLLAGVNTPRSDEDSIKLKELMDFCTKLQQRVLDLENTKTAQAQKITSLKLRVKKLEKKGGSRTQKLKRLYKVGLIARVESSDDELSLGEDASKQGRKIHDIDADEDITLENVHDAEMFDVNDLHGEEDKGKAIMVEEPVKKFSKKDQIRLDEELAFKLQAEEEEEERLAREKDEANVALTEECDDI